MGKGKDNTIIKKDINLIKPIIPSFHYCIIPIQIDKHKEFKSNPI